MRVFTSGTFQNCFNLSLSHSILKVFMSYFHFFEKFLFDRSKTKPISTGDAHEDANTSLGCHFDDLERAQKECTKYTNCKGVTQIYSKYNLKWFEPRWGMDLQLRKSNRVEGENAWIKDASCKTLGQKMDIYTIAMYKRQGGKKCD